MHELIDPVVVFYWITFCAIFIVTWGALMFSILHEKDEDRETARRVFLAGLLTVVMLSFVGWALQTQAGFKIVSQEQK